MGVTLADLRPIYVVGVGWHRYQNVGPPTYVEMGLKAIRDALADAAIDWSAVESSYIGTALLGMASGQPMLKHLGAHGQPLLHVENASASGSAAFRHGCIEIAAGLSDVALVLGVDKRDRPGGRSPTGMPSLADDAILPFTHFSLLTNQYIERYGASAEDIARVALKNHANAALNPNAQRQKVRTLDEIMAGKRIAGTLTSLQCTMFGEGAAAVIISSEAGIKRLGIDQGKAVRVASSAALSEAVGSSDSIVSQQVIERALAEAQTAPSEIDVFELHDAFTIEEAHYAEASGLCPPGRYLEMLKEGAWDIGGKCAVSSSGGLIAMGHPIGPTGVGQIGEIALQLRGEAGARQHQGARTGLAHMVGLGAVGYAHLLRRD